MFCFFFQAEDGIRDLTVTGVQTCALPILSTGCCGIAALNMLSKDSHINAGVEDEHEDADDDLVPPREAGGVDDGHDVVRYEAAAVAGPSGLLQEVVFPLRERTIPAEPLDQHTPHRR